MNNKELKLIHHILEKDPVTRRGICSVCGPIWLQRNSNGVLRCGRKHDQVKKTRRKSIKIKLSEKRGSCQRCGFVPVDTRQMDIHHIDRNRKNTDESNLEYLCANCHRLEHDWKGLNRKPKKSAE